MFQRFAQWWRGASATPSEGEDDYVVVDSTTPPIAEEDAEEVAQVPEATEEADEVDEIADEVAEGGAEVDESVDESDDGSADESDDTLQVATAHDQSPQKITIGLLWRLATACRYCYNTREEGGKIVPTTVNSTNGRVDVWPCGTIISRHIVVAVEGTDEFGDWFDNLDMAIVRDPLSGKHYHRGFRDHATEIWNAGLGIALHQETERAAGRDDDSSLCGFMVTGHSLGGAVAEILADYIEQAFPALARSCITFGAPRVRAKGYSGEVLGGIATTHVETEGFTHHLRVVHELDVVPLAPTAWRFAHSNACLWLSRDGRALGHGWHEYLSLFLRALWTPGLQTIADHGIDKYIDALRKSGVDVMCELGSLASQATPL